MIAFVALPSGLNGHWLITGTAWLVIAAVLAWRYRRHRRAHHRGLTPWCALRYDKRLPGSPSG